MWTKVYKQPCRCNQDEVAVDECYWLSCRPIETTRWCSGSEVAMTSRLLIVTFVYVICPSLTSLAVDVISPRLDSFDALVRRLMDCRRVPGLVAAVVDLRRSPAAGGCVDGPRDSVVVQRQYGLADVEARRPMRSNTRVCIASLTKAFTSTLLGIMLQNITRQVSILSYRIGTVSAGDCICGMLTSIAMNNFYFWFPWMMPYNYTEHLG